MIRGLARIIIAILVITNFSSLAEAATPIAGSKCSRVGQIASTATKKFTCIKSGKKLIWNKGVAIKSEVRPTPASTAMATPTPTPTPSKTPIPVATPTQAPSSPPSLTPTPQPTSSRVYIAKDQTTLHHLTSPEGCSNPITTKVELQAQIDDVWITIPSVNSGWTINPQSCPSEQLGKKTSLAWADVYIDQGTTYRWYFIGEVNIFHHDQLGNGYSESQLIPVFIKPNPVVGGYGITWENIIARIPEISAAAWTDAQATIKRNSGLPSPSDSFMSYISRGALATDPQLADAEIALKRTFTLFQRFPSAQKVFFVALTIPERLETQDKLNSMYSKAQFMNKSIDEMVGINNSLPAGSSNIWPTDCRSANIMRNTFLYRTEAEAAAVIWIVCPDLQNNNLHFEGSQGTAHEYIHTIQMAFKPGTPYGYSNIPCWMREGEPEWGQTAVASNFTNYLKAQHLHPYLLTSDGLNYQNTSARNWTMEEVASYLISSSDITKCALTNQYAYSYSLGAAATEALVSIAGSESFFALHERIIAGVDYNTAFNEIYGITWDKAVPILAQVVAKKITKSWDTDALTYQTRPGS
jgi:hypothetical protein